jgi:hypothetical protein
MRKVAILLLGVFGVTYVATIGARMSSEALAVIVGVICGAAAGIPVSLLILAAARRPHRYDAQERYGTHAYPPVVVIQGGTQSPLWPGSCSGTQMHPPALAASENSAPRQFRVVGTDEWEAC